MRKKREKEMYRIGASNLLPITKECILYERRKKRYSKVWSENIQANIWMGLIPYICVYEHGEAQMIYYYVITTIFIKLLTCCFSYGTRVASDYNDASTQTFQCMDKVVKTGQHTHTQQIQTHIINCQTKSCKS